jgi:4-aminobutyrate aminotransferase-like enzyme
MEGLRAMKSRYPILGDVRGRGLMIGIEIVSDRDRTPAPILAKALEAEAVKNGVLISTTGVYGNTLRITPPLVITENQVERALDILDKSLLAVSEKRKMPA